MTITARIRQALAYRREFLRVMDELETYRDHELSDLRIDRADFPGVAREAAEAHVASMAAPRGLRVPAGWREARGGAF